LRAAHGEEVVEGDHSINLRQRQLERGGDVAQHVGAQVPEELLRRV
jgi:hypothetical protein